MSRKGRGEEENDPTYENEYEHYSLPKKQINKGGQKTVNRR